MDPVLLSDITMISGLALGVVLVCHRLGVPAIVGFLLTGVLAGPHGLALVRDAHQVEILAEVGVICLLFTIGLEFSLSQLLSIRKLVLLGGSVQVGLTIPATAWLAHMWGMDLNNAVFCGFLVALSSTAIGLKILQQRAEVDSPHGRFNLAVLVFQDIAVVPMILVAPVLAGQGSGIATELTWLLLKAVAVLAVVAITARWVVPQALYQAARLRDRELFVLGVVFVALSVAWLTSAAKLSLALGAFIAGLIISESEYAHRALGNALPFRDLFTSLFFVSVGMLLDIGYVAQKGLFLASMTAGILTLKVIIAAVAALCLGLPLRTAILGGIALGQIGEFAFVLSKSGLELNLMEPDTYQLFLGVSVISMIAAPFMVASGQGVATWMLRLPWPERLRSGMRSPEEPAHEGPLVNHVILVGYGLNGRNLNRAAEVAGIPRVIIELNPDTVRAEKAKGLPIFYGDASQEAVLEHASIKDARVMVIVVSDPAAVRRMVEAARRLNPAIHIIARCRFFSEMEPLFELGADEVIPEDYEVSVEILARVLTKYLVPRGDIERFISKARSEHYRLLRSIAYESASFSDLEFVMPDSEIASLRICPGSPAEGKTLGDLALRSKHRVTVLAIRRGPETLPNPSGSQRIAAGDVLLILAAPEDTAQLAGILESGNASCDILP